MRYIDMICFVVIRDSPGAQQDGDILAPHEERL